MKVLITRPILNTAKELLEKNNIEVFTGPETGMTPEQLADEIKKVDGVICMLSDKMAPSILQNATRLKVIANYAVGFDNIDITYAKEKNIRVGNTPGVLTEATAELALTLLMSVQRQVKASIEYIKADNWKTWHPTDLLGHNLGDRTIGIVGMGRIGFQFAKMCHQAFGSKILYTHTREHQEANNLLGAQRVTINELFQNSHAVSLHCPLKDNTKHLVDLELLEQTPKGFILINTARGQVIKQDDLITALDKEIIWGAGLDVTDPEPLPLEHPLYQHNRCIILPHLGSATQESRSAMAIRAAENIIAGLKNEELPYSVI